MKDVAKKGKYTLRYERIINDYGFEQDVTELFDTEKRISIPFMPMIKVNNATRNSPINKLYYEYTQEDFEKMLDEQIKKYESRS